MATLLFQTETIFHLNSVYSGTLPSGKTLKIKIELSRMKDKFSRASIFKEDEMRWICLIEDNYVIPKKSNLLVQKAENEMEDENNINMKNQERTEFYFSCLLKLIS